MAELIAQRYEIHELIGQGGMGEVFRGLDTQTGQAVAIKRLKPEIVADDPDLVRRFYDLGPGLASATLAKVLAAAQARGEIGPCDPQAAADHFVGMIRGIVQLKVMRGLRGAPGAAARTALVASAVDIFLTGLGHRV